MCIYEKEDSFPLKLWRVIFCPQASNQMAFFNENKWMDLHQLLRLQVFSKQQNCSNLSDTFYTL